MSLYLLFFLFSSDLWYDSINVIITEKLHTDIIVSIIILLYQNNHFIFVLIVLITIFMTVRVWVCRSNAAVGEIGLVDTEFAGSRRDPVVRYACATGGPLQRVVAQWVMESRVIMACFGRRLTRFFGGGCSGVGGLGVGRHVRRINHA